MSMSSQLWIGSYVNEEKKPFYLRIKDLYTHLAIIGSSGSGKTVLAKTIIEGTIVHDIPSIVVDPQGDLVRLAQLDENFIDDLKEGDDAKELATAFSEKYFPVIITPGTKHALKGIFNPLSSFPDPTRVQLHRGIIFDSLVEDANPEVRLVSEEELAMLLGGIADSILSFIPDAYLKGRNRPSFRVIIFKSLNKAFESGMKLEAITDFMEWLSNLDDAGFFSESEEKTLKNIINALKVLIEGPESILFSDGIPIDPTLFLTAPPGKIPLVLFYLNVLPNLRSKQSFLANLTLMLYSYCLQKGRGRFLYFIDEIRDFIPSGTRQVPSKEILKTFFMQSRKYEVISVMATQSVGSVDYEVLGQCNTRAYGRITVEQDLKKLKDFLPSEVLDELPDNIPGEFLIHTKDGRYHKIQVRRLVTQHGSPIPPQELANVVKQHRDVLEYYSRFWKKEAELNDRETLLLPEKSRRAASSESSHPGDASSSGTIAMLPPDISVEFALDVLKRELIEFFHTRMKISNFKLAWKMLDESDLIGMMNSSKVDKVGVNAFNGPIYQLRSSVPVIISLARWDSRYLVLTAFVMEK